MNPSYSPITGIYSNSSYWCLQQKAVCERRRIISFHLILLTPLFSRLSPSFLLGFASVVTRESLSRVYDQLVVADTAATSQNQHHEITDGEVADPDRYFHVIDAFKMPRVTYDQKRKVFEKCVVAADISRRRSKNASKREDSSNLPSLFYLYAFPSYQIRVPTPPTILPPASAKPAHLRERLNLIRSIVLRNHNFLPPLALGQGKERDAFMKVRGSL